jgi:hypothetical protein
VADFIAVFCWNPIEWLLNTVIPALLEILIDAMMPLFGWGVELLGDLLMIALSDLLFDLLVIMLKIVDFFTSAFFAFSGAYNVALPSGGSGNYAQSDTFVLQYLMDNMGLTRIYWILTVLSAALCIIFTGVSILRSMNATEFDPKNTVGKIWGRLGRTMLTFLVIPAMMLYGIELSTVVTGSLVETGDTTASVDSMIFLATTMNAAKNEDFNDANASFSDPVRGKYYSGAASYEALDNRGNRLCANDFDFKEIDYFTGYLLCGFMIFILFGAALMAVRRLFEIMLLYITAPLFVASMPLDEGKRFEGWRNMFVAKLVSVYGLIIMMTLYLALVPTIMGGSLNLSYGVSSAGVNLGAADGLMDSLLKTLLLLGGAFALKNSHSILLGIISPEAAQSAQGSVLAGMAMGMGALGSLRRGASRALTGRGQSASAAPKSSAAASPPAVQHANAEDAQKFSG